ncbi:MAG TPA: glycosyltransferase [Flavisolibacter sp.]|nr:glycosyltransferase [Flavisolibacter sp.]
MNDPLKIAGFVVFTVYALTSVWLLLNSMVQLHLLWHFKRREKKRLPVQSLQPDLPFVSVQVPVYNEKYVIRRLLTALGKLNYPRDRFEIQVLDDSTDETSQIIDNEADWLRERGIHCTVVRRQERKGFKAGALQYGLSYCKGGLVAIFDADFIPDPSFLLRMVPHFSDASVGLVQAKWTHINRDQNSLTRIQTFLLDTHFSVEQGGRHQAGYFINFCGTAGIWRKECIEQAGGWDGEVLSEDLDLSYRAQLKGWKMVYDKSVEVPAELPCVIQAFRIQQFRWTKGMAQISKKMMKPLLKAAVPVGKKLHGVFHLLGSFVFVCLLLNALLTLPLLVFRNLYPEFITLTHYTLVTSLNLVALTLFYYTGTKSSNSPGTVRFGTYYPLFLVIYMGLSVQNAIAVLQGFAGKHSPFVRTPKFAAVKAGENAYLRPKFNGINLLEIFLFSYFFTGIVLSFYFGDYFMLLFFLMMVYGLGFIIAHTLMLFQQQSMALRTARG